VNTHTSQSFFLGKRLELSGFTWSLSLLRERQGSLEMKGMKDDNKTRGLELVKRRKTATLLLIFSLYLRVFNKRGEQRV